jgi:hypothetical protein
MCDIEKSTCQFCEKEIDKYQSSIIKGKRYYSKSKINKYCSKDCSKEGRKKRKNINCKQCDKVFEVILSRDTIFCSRGCMWDYERQYQERNYSNMKIGREESNKNLIEINCEVCDKIFLPTTSLNKICSEQCSWQKSRPAHKAARKKRIYERKTLLLNKFDNKCSICGYNKCSRSLTFHHIDSSTKEFTLDSGNLFRYTLNKILLESEKCKLLCQNCHSNLHEKEREQEIAKSYENKRERYVKRKTDLINKFGGCCVKCGYKDEGIQSLTFHHKIKSEKLFPLDCMAFIRKSDNEIYTESQKCELVCFNCHMEQENDERLVIEGSGAHQIVCGEDGVQNLLSLSFYLPVGESL